MANQFSGFLRSQVDIQEKALKLGVRTSISHDEAMRVFIRAAEEIERLNDLVENQRK